MHIQHLYGLGIRLSIRLLMVKNNYLLKHETNETKIVDGCRKKANKYDYDVNERVFSKHRYNVIYRGISTIGSIDGNFFF